VVALAAQQELVLLAQQIPAAVVVEVENLMLEQQAVPASSS
jgi:hypothetical protein